MATVNSQVILGLHAPLISKVDALGFLAPCPPTLSLMKEAVPLRKEGTWGWLHMAWLAERGNAAAAAALIEEMPS